MMPPPPKRSRVIYAGTILIVAWLGISARYHGDYLPIFVNDYAGDTLWALVVFSLIGLVFPSAATWFSAAGAYMISALVEFSEVANAPWVASMRGTPLGALALGTDFLVTDLACYAVGVVLGMLIELWALP
jgi:hypothetical protein